ncbi:hypothetical protein [Streptosporangium saharense]|uniref:Uncharacterized protein n=1 Tax=Streptosporangium saharense TaxID=1706840 RepID=A0A7W7QW97_9ACTN|nr:hypothetical protein [Streptosporangium saharense]MBB4920962.1 hypothetical protein [Streptosporangium saharense]
MVQVRLMHHDPERVRQVAELLLPLLRESGLLHVGDENEVPNRRDGGLRVFFELTPATRPSPGYVYAERVDPAPPARRTRPRTALPPGRSTRPLT